MSEIKRVDFSGKKVIFKGNHPQIKTGEILLVEGYWDEITGENWAQSADKGNPGALIYAIRSAQEYIHGVKTLFDDNVLYTHSVTSGLGHLVHISEVEEVK